MRDEAPPSAAAGPGRGPVSLSVTPRAASELRRALEGQAAEVAVRLFVGGGAHPEVGMSLDRPTARDETVTVEGIRFAIDTGSRPFLDEATVDYVSLAEGAGFRVTGPNVPGPSEPAASGEPEPPAPGGKPGGLDGLARAALKKVYDPEIPMNIVDLGLVYELNVSKAGKARVRFTLTSPGCPVGDMLVEQVRTAVLEVPGVKQVEVELVWEPPWSPEKMSEFARRQLGFA